MYANCLGPAKGSMDPGTQVVRSDLIWLDATPLGGLLRKGETPHFDLNSKLTVKNWPADKQHKIIRKDLGWIVWCVRIRRLGKTT